jgi:hypothetical protein
VLGVVLGVMLGVVLGGPGWRVGMVVHMEFMLNQGHSMPYGLMFAQVMSWYRVCVRILPLGVLRENRRDLRFGWGQLDHRWTLLGRCAFLAPDDSPSSSWAHCFYFLFFFCLARVLETSTGIITAVA